MVTNIRLLALILLCNVAVADERLQTVLSRDVVTAPTFERDWTIDGVAVKGKITGFNKGAVKINNTEFKLDLFSKVDQELINKVIATKMAGNPHRRRDHLCTRCQSINHFRAALENQKAFSLCHFGCG